MQSFIQQKSLRSPRASCLLFWMAGVVTAASIPLYPAKAAAQDSLIADINASLRSIVHVTADIQGVYKSPGAKAAFDQATGRLLVLRNIKTAVHRREGAGVILSESGFIATNAHIVRDATAITVELNSKKRWPARLARVIPAHDLAILKISPPSPLHPITIADSNQIRLGDEVVTVGNSNLLKRTISGGKVIGLGRRSSTTLSRANRANELIQTDIRLYKGDSGGPLLNKDGELVGLMMAGQKQKRNSSFAIPSNIIYRDFLDYVRSFQEKSDE